MADDYCNSGLPCSRAAAPGLLLLSIAAELRMLLAAGSEHHRLPHALQNNSKDMIRALKLLLGHSVGIELKRAADCQRLAKKRKMQAC
jgi:hypothetical protein